MSEHKIKLIVKAPSYAIAKANEEIALANRAESKATHKEDSKLETHVEKMVRLAKSQSGNCFLQKDWLYAIDRLAEELRKKGDTYEQSFAKALTTPDGAVLYDAYINAKEAEPEPVKIEKQTAYFPDTPAWTEIENLASEHQSSERQNSVAITKEQAISHILSTDTGKALNKKYEVELQVIRTPHAR